MQSTFQAVTDLLRMPQDFGVPWILEDFKPVIKPITTNSPPLCAVCKTPDSKDNRCGNCKTINYCSSECQVKDWKQHKVICRAFTSFLDLGVQDPKCRRALYFPVDDVSPHFVPVEYGTNGLPSSVREYFPDTPRADLKTIGYHNRFQSYWVQIMYDSNPHGNRCLRTNATMIFALGSADAVVVFRGPFLVITYDGVYGLYKPALDADTSIYAPLLDYMKMRCEYDGPIFVEQPQEMYQDEEWKGLMGPAAARVKTE